MIGSSLFAQRLCASLRNGTISVAEGADYQVTGELGPKYLFAPIEVRVPFDFAVLRQIPPRVWCRKFWMRDDTDWHNRVNSGMCWVLEEEWRDAMGWDGKPPHAVIEEGNRWLVEAVGLLVVRHFVGHAKGFTEWPRQWKAWAHFGEGAREYEKWKIRNCIPVT